MNVQALRRDAAYSGWIRTLLARALATLQRLLGMQVFRVNLRPIRGHPAEPRPPDGITLRLMRLEELVEAAADPEFEFEPAFARAALAQGDLVFGAYDGDRLISLTWRTPTAAPLAESIWVRIGPRCHHAYKTFVKASHRGRRIHTAVSCFADRYSVERGCPAEIGLINIANLASIGAAQALGRKKVGYAGYVSVFGHCIPFRTAGVRDIGVELFKPHETAIDLVPAQG